MKHILFVLISIICLCSCDIPTEENSRTGERKAIQNNDIVFEVIYSSAANPVSWYEIEKDGERHEFVWVGRGHGGLTHWPGCKYCKEMQKQID